MTTAELKEYLQMMVDLERDLYTEQEMEESIRKKIAQCYISPPARTFEGYCRKRRYDASLPTLPSGEVPAKPSAPQKENFQVKDFRMSIGVFALTIFAGVIFPPCVIIVPLVVKHYRAKKSEALYNSALEEYVKQCGGKVEQTHPASFFFAISCIQRLVILRHPLYDKGV